MWYHISTVFGTIWFWVRLFISGISCYWLLSFLCCTRFSSTNYTSDSVNAAMLQYLVLFNSWFDSLLQGYQTLFQSPKLLVTASWLMSNGPRIQLHIIQDLVICCHNNNILVDKGEINLLLLQLFHNISQWTLPFWQCRGETSMIAAPCCLMSIAFCLSGHEQMYYLQFECYHGGIVLYYHTVTTSTSNCFLCIFLGCMWHPTTSSSTSSSTSSASFSPKASPHPIDGEISPHHLHLPPFLQVPADGVEPNKSHSLDLLAPKISIQVLADDGKPKKPHPLYSLAPTDSMAIQEYCILFTLTISGIDGESSLHQEPIVLGSMHGKGRQPHQWQ